MLTKSIFFTIFLLNYLTAQNVEYLQSETFKQTNMPFSEAERVGTVTAQYAQGKKSASQRSTAEQAIANQKMAQEAALRDKRLGKQAKAPGISSVNIKGPGGVGGTGKPGAVTRSAKDLRNKKKNNLNIG